MACSMDAPCGGILTPALENADMIREGLPQRFFTCLAGHALVINLPPPLPPSKGRSEGMTGETRRCRYCKQPFAVTKRRKLTCSLEHSRLLSTNRPARRASHKQQAPTIAPRSAPGMYW